MSGRIVGTMRAVGMLAAAGTAPPAAAAKVPVALESVGPWQVDYGTDACLLGRRFAEGKKEVVLGWRILPLEDAMEIIVTRQSADGRFALGEATVALAGGASEQTGFESFPTAKSGYSSLRLRVPAAMFGTLDEEAVLTIAPKGMRAIAFRLRGPRKAFAAVATCNDATATTWGIDPAERQRVATGPEPVGDPRNWVNAADYPRGVVGMGQQGTTAILFRIATTGRIDMCRTVVTSGSTVLDDAACAALQKRGRYTPARDAAGQPMAMHRVRRVTWRLPGVWNAGR